MTFGSVEWLKSGLLNRWFADSCTLPLTGDNVGRGTCTGVKGKQKGQSVVAFNVDVLSATVAFKWDRVRVTLVMACKLVIIRCIYTVRVACEDRNLAAVLRA